MQEDSIKGRDGVQGGQYKREGWCRRTLQKGVRVHKEGIIKEKDDTGGHYIREQ